MQRILHILLSLLVFCGAVHAQQTVGLFKSDPWKSYNGLTLFTPNFSKTTYLIDNCGRRVHSWSSAYLPGNSVYLQNDGSILRPGGVSNPKFRAGGSGGIIERIAWDGTVLWSYRMSNDTECQHHDITPLPNGNVLVLSWDARSPLEKQRVGRTDIKHDTVWSEKVVELRPIGTNQAEIVWQWFLWDHLVQDRDSTLQNYAIVSQHPELVDANILNTALSMPDWLHMNALDYDSVRDEIVLSVHHANEFWVIDHSTTVTEAASHQGGRRHHGGDIVYRWGNPFMYTQDPADTALLGGQHNVQFRHTGNEHELSFVLFNNMAATKPVRYSSIDIITAPLDEDGNYRYVDGQYLPRTTSWRYVANPPESLFSPAMSSVQILPNKNMLVCSAMTGNFMEISETSEIVWKYVNPDANGIALKQGSSDINNTVFRCTRYPVTHPAFRNKSVVGTIELEQDPLPSDCQLLSRVESLPESPTATVHLSIVGSDNCSASRVLFNSDKQQDAELRVYNINGALIRVLFSGSLTAEGHSLDISSVLNDGVYFFELRTAEEVRSIPCILTNSASNSLR